MKFEPNQTSCNIVQQGVQTMQHVARNNVGRCCMQHVAFVWTGLYATQVWTPQSIEVIKFVEQVQRRAVQNMSSSNPSSPKSHTKRYFNTNLLPLTHCHEFLDLIFLSKLSENLIAIVLMFCRSFGPLSELLDHLLTPRIAELQPLLHLFAWGVEHPASLLEA